MVESLDNDSTFENIFNVLVETNTSKIKQIKSQMNDLIESQDYRQSFNNLPPYLDYTLYMLTITYPIIKKYIKDVNKIISVIDNYTIHPSIFQFVYSNIIFSIYINEIKLDENLLKDKIFIESIQNIYNEIEILMSIFTKIFMLIDSKYKLTEDKLYYNYISGLSNIEFIEYSEKIDYTLSDLSTRTKILDIFIIEIDHLTQIEMNDNIIDNDQTLDIDIFVQISNKFNSIIIANFNYNIKYEKYNKMKNINILELQEKNSIYYWIDHVALINSKILNRLNFN